MVRGEETRLFLLAELDQRGEAHGHELRREAQVGRSELWTAVRIGSIYSTLKRLDAEGLIAAVRDERPTRMPQRTIYAITTEGRRELGRLRDAALREVALPADPFDLAWSFAADVPAGQLADILADRLRELDGRAHSLEHQRQAAADYLDERDHQLFDHLAARLRTEVEFHERLHATLQRSEQRRPTVTSTDTTSRVKQLASRSFRVTETGETALAETIIAPGYVNHEAADDPNDPDRQLAGPAGFLATSRWLRDAFAELSFHEREIAVDGHTVLVATTMTGRHTGTFQGIAATGRTVEQNQVHILTIAEGQITSHRAVRDDLGLLLQLGWRPGRGAS